MPMFGVYYIPDAESALYQTASNLMGYDVRTGKLLPEINPHRERFNHFNPEWALAAQEFGFHATIGHVMHFDPKRLSQIEDSIETLWNLCDPEKPFLLTPTEEFLYVNGTSLTLYYHANQPLMMFHAMVVANIHPLGNSTPFSVEYATGKHANLTPAQHYRTRMYHQYWILDDWFPHLRILGQITDNIPENLYAELLNIIPEPEMLTVDSVCLVIKEDEETHFKLHREFMRSDYPKQL